MLATFPNYTDPKVLRHTSKVQNTGHLSRKPSPIVQARMDKRRRGPRNIVGGPQPDLVGGASGLKGMNLETNIRKAFTNLKLAWPSYWRNGASKPGE